MKKICFILLLACVAVRGNDDIKPDEQQCRAHLQALGQALKLYLIYNDGRLPAHISELYQQGFLPDLEVFSCPASGTRITDTGQIDKQTDYILTTMVTDEKPLPLLKERAGFHDGQALTFYSDMSIRRTAAAPPVPAAVFPPASQTAGETAQIKNPAGSASNGAAWTQAGSSNTATNRKTSSSQSGTPPSVGPLKMTDVTNLFANHQFLQALPLLDKMVADSPQERLPRFQRGTARIWLNDLKGAMSDFSTLVTNNPQDFESRRMRATLELLAGDRHFALQEAESLDRLAPETATICVLHAQAAWFAGDTQTARREFAHAQRLNSAVADVLLNEAVQFDRAGVLKVAYLEYVSVAWLKPDYYRANYGIGNTAARLGMKKQAIDALEEFLRHETTGEYADSARRIINQLQAGAATQSESPAR